MSFSLDREIMKKSFSMGDNGDRFTHNAAKKMKLFPFIANNNALTIQTLSQVVGEWLRIVKKQKYEPQQMDDTINNIIENVDVDEEGKEKLFHILKELYWDEKNQLRPNSIDSMIYVPVSDPSEEKMAQYLFSVLSSGDQLQKIVEKATEQSSQKANVLEKAVMEALRKGCTSTEVKERYFALHTAARDMFAEDLRFVLETPSRTKEYLVDLLEFYYFFYTSQSCLLLDQFAHGNRKEIVPLFFSLDWEKTNKARECYKFGWIQLQPAINNLFYHAITLEILNQRDSDERYDYIAIKAEETDENAADMAAQVREVTNLYRNAIIAISSSSECEAFNNIIKREDLGTVFSEIRYLYDSVKVQFEHSVRNRANNAYVEKFRVYCQENFLKTRGQVGRMLNMTEERLIFLTKLAIKDNDQMSLNDVFQQFKNRGVYFDSSSKEEIIKFYSKLNLIDKKSDSGDAQYVKRFL